MTINELRAAVAAARAGGWNSDEITLAGFITGLLGRLHEQTQEIDAFNTRLNDVILAWNRETGRAEAAEQENEKLRKLIGRVLSNFHYDPRQQSYMITEAAWFNQPYQFKNPADWLIDELTKGG